MSTKNVNSVILQGNLGNNPEIVSGENKALCVKFRLAVATLVVISGETHERTFWHTIVCFDEMAKNVLEKLATGNRVQVQGYLASRTYTNEEGIKRVSVSVVADDIDVIEKQRETTAAKVPAEAKKKPSPRKPATVKPSKAKPAPAKAQTKPKLKPNPQPEPEQLDDEVEEQSPQPQAPVNGKPQTTSVLQQAGRVLSKVFGQRAIH